MDKRFEQIIASIDRLGDKLERRDENQRPFTLRMFTIAIGISVIGALRHFLETSRRFLEVGTLQGRHIGTVKKSLTEGG